MEDNGFSSGPATTNKCSGRFLRVYNVEIHQGSEIVKCRIPVGSFEPFSQMFLNEHVVDDTRLFITGISVFDFEKFSFL